MPRRPSQDSGAGSGGNKSARQRTPRVVEEGLDSSDDDELQFSGIGGIGAVGMKAPKEQKKPGFVDARGQEWKAVFGKIEPKVFFANERNFLGWTRACLLLITIGFVVAEAGRKTAAGQLEVIGGSILTMIGVVFIIYAYILFRWRANRIKAQRQGPFDDNFGPPVLTSALIAAAIMFIIINNRELANRQAAGGGGGTP